MKHCDGDKLWRTHVLGHTAFLNWLFIVGMFCFSALIACSKPQIFSSSACNSRCGRSIKDCEDDKMWCGWCASCESTCVIGYIGTDAAPDDDLNALMLTCLKLTAESCICGLGCD